VKECSFLIRTCLFSFRLIFHTSKQNMRVSENAKTAAAKYVGVKDVVEVAVWG
jgi:hypothetical protein